MTGKPFWVLEDIDALPRRKLFALFGVDWLATPYAWLGVPLYGAAGMAIALATGEAGADPVTWPAGLGYGALFFLTNVAHTLGHILSGALAGHPMNANLLTATFDMNVYDGDQTVFPRRVHVIRALGGPLLNLVCGVLGIGLGMALGRTWLTVFGCLSAAGGLWTLVPIRPMDGWAIRRALRAE